MGNARVGVADRNNGNVATDLYLIRHGESVANVEPIIGGMRGDVGLTERGQRQVELLGNRLTAEGFRADVLVASTLPRAQQTAAVVSQALQLPVQPDDDLQELRPGEADGLSVLEWERRFPGLENGHLANPEQPFAPGGESWVGFVRRVGDALLRLINTHPDHTVVAVCHGGVIEASFYLAFGLDPTATRVSFDPLNSGLTHWRHSRRTNRMPPWRLMVFNDANHLQDSGLDSFAPPAVP